MITFNVTPYQAVMASFAIGFEPGAWIAASTGPLTVTKASIFLHRLALLACSHDSAKLLFFASSDA